MQFNDLTVTWCPQSHKASWSGIVQLAISFNLALNSSSVTANQGKLASFAGYKRGEEVVWEWVYGSTTLREPSLIPRLLHSRTWEWDYRELTREQTKTETRNKMTCALVRATELLFKRRLQVLCNGGWEDLVCFWSQNACINDTDE